VFVQKRTYSWNTSIIPPVIMSKISWLGTVGTDSLQSRKGSNLSREQQGLLNFDEISALWYFALAFWYGYFIYKRRMHMQQRRRQYHQQHYTTTDSSVAAVHWFIFSIAIMGLASFLFSFSLLEVLDHRSVIGSSVKKLSYASESYMVTFYHLSPGTCVRIMFLQSS
jgi:hypothetical protein